MKQVNNSEALLGTIRKYCALNNFEKPLLIWFGREVHSNPILDSFKKLLLAEIVDVQQVNDGGVVETSDASIILYHSYLNQVEQSFLEDAIKTGLKTKKPVIVFANSYESANRPTWVGNCFEEIEYSPALTVALVTCSSMKKKGVKGKICARDLYVGPLFLKAWVYADRMKVDYKFILSDKYGLLQGDHPIGPYNYSLRSASVSIRRAWASTVLDDLRRKGFDLNKDRFIVLAGKVYYEFLVGPQGLTNADLVFATNNLHGIGQILHFLK